MTRFELAQQMIDRLPETWSPQAQQQLIDALEALAVSAADGSPELQRYVKSTMRKIRKVWRFPDTAHMGEAYGVLRIKLAVIQATMRPQQ